MGSEMCIRDSVRPALAILASDQFDLVISDKKMPDGDGFDVLRYCCLLYTSDAADERSSVDLGGRRIIKKNINKRHNSRSDSENRSNI